MADTTEWFYATDKGERLKCTVEELAKLLKDKSISNGTLVWNNQMDEWKLLADLPDLYEKLVMRGTASGEVVWHFVHTGTSKQTGPVSALELKRLLGTGDVKSSSMVWKASLANWTPLSQVAELTPIIGEQKSSEGPAEWFYVDSKREKQGPVSLQALKASVDAKDVTPNTLIWKVGMAEWVKISVCTEEPIINLMKDGGGKKNSKKKKKTKKKKKWTNVQDHGNVYITGLPSDVTVEELIEYFAACGVIKPDLKGTPRVKVYRNPSGVPKGDGLVCFAHEASVNLAITLHDGAQFRPNVKITVQKADFQQKGDYVAKSLSTADVEAIQKQKLEQKKKMGWTEGNQTIDKRRIVVLKHMFLPDEALQYPNFYNGIRQEIGYELERVCGRIEKMTVFEGSPEGVIAVKFTEPAFAESCIQEFDGRWYAFRQLAAAYFDGTDYRVKETEEEKKARIAKFGDWLKSQQAANEAAQEETMADLVTEAVNVEAASAATVGDTRPSPSANENGPNAKRAKTG